MGICAVCGCSTPNPITCRQHSRINSQFKSCNNWRRKRGQPELSWEAYLQRRDEAHINRPKPRMFLPEDCTGPTVTWDGTDRSPCASCEHSLKDHSRWGCIKCKERSRYDEWISRGVHLYASHYSQFDLTAVVCSRR
jgi:hypothetical protein